MNKIIKIRTIIWLHKNIDICLSSESKVMKNKQILLIFLLLINSCANKKSSEFDLRNTLPDITAKSIVKICSNNKMDADSNKMVPVNGFDLNSKSRVSQSQIDSSISVIEYPTGMYLKSFFDFGMDCKSEKVVTINELRTYVNYNGYGMGVYGITYKVEAIISSFDEDNLFISDYFSGYSESENLGMLSPDKKEIEYQSAALTSAFYNLYKNIVQKLN